MTRTLPIHGLIVLSLALAGAACAGGEGTGKLPDLYVANIGCAGGNLVLTVGNKGGALPKGWEAAAALSIDGGAQEVFPLVLPGETKMGDFDKGGGTIDFVTATRITDYSGISVTLDYSDQVREADETNNSVRSWHVEPCDLPDLVVEDLGLDEDCFVRLTVRNIGPGPIGEAAWSYEFLDYCGVSIYIDGNEAACVPFLTFDAERGLKPSGGRAVLRSKIRIDKDAVVLAVVDSTQVILEANEANNRASATLRCAKGPSSR